MNRLGDGLRATWSAEVGVAASLTAENIGVGAYTTLGHTSSLTVRVHKTNTPSPSDPIPQGSYRVRFNVVNVGKAVTLSLTPTVGAPASCALAERPGYQNVQTCDVVVTTSSPFSVTARYAPGTGTPQITLRSVEVAKTS